MTSSANLSGDLDIPGLYNDMRGHLLSRTTLHDDYNNVLCTRVMECRLEQTMLSGEECWEMGRMEKARR